MNSNGRCGSSLSIVEPGAAVAGVDHDLELAQVLAIHVAEQVLDVLGRRLERLDLALHGRGRR